MQQFKEASEAPSNGLQAGGARRLTGFDFARRTSKKGRREGEEPPSLSGQAQDPAQRSAQDLLRNRLRTRAVEEEGALFLICKSPHQRGRYTRVCARGRASVLQGSSP